LINLRKELFVIKDETMNYQDRSNEKQVLSAASIPKILQKLTDPYYDDENFSLVLLIYHDYFMKSSVLLDEVLKVFLIKR